MEKSLRTNGFKIRSWGDLAALATVVSVLLALYIGVLLWGLKLETELNIERNINRANVERIAKLEEVIDQGILKVARTEIDNLENRLNRHEANDH